MAERNLSIVLTWLTPAPVYGCPMPNTGWMRDGLCQQVDPDLFYREEHQRYDAARKVCSTCVVKDKCLSYALAECETEGMWGGLTPKERAVITQLNNRALVRMAG